VKRSNQVAVWIGLAAIVAASPALARDQIRIVGSSTVYPFATAVAEQFGRTTAFKTPVIESTGSGGGLKLFCAGVGLDTPDITNASRRIKASEVKRCHSNGVEEIVEVKIGYDGIVIANSKKSEAFSLSLRHLFLALAREIPVDGQLVANPNRSWHDVDPSLPDRRIEVLGPPPTSGTRDAFVELAMQGGAKQIPMLAELRKRDKHAFKEIAESIREDGAYVEAGENDNLIVQKLVANPDALGIFGYSFLEENEDRIQGSRVEGVEPTFEAIAGASYPISRSLFFYVKKAHVERVPGMKQYIAEFTSRRAAGEEGYLAERGLIPLSARDLELVRNRAVQLQPFSM